MTAAKTAAAALPLVSVIVPTYNVEHFIGLALPELGEQTYPNLEFIIVDDASTDETVGLIRRHLAREPRARLFVQDTNQGVAAARERAVAEARGEYLWLVDADDSWPRQAVESLVARAQADRSEIVVCDAEYLYDNGARVVALGVPAVDTPLVGHEAFHELLEGRIKGHLWNKLFAATLFDELVYPRIRVHSDLAMTAQLIARARRVSVLPETLYGYNVRPGSLITSGGRRDDELAKVDEIVARCVRDTDDARGIAAAHRYFQLRFILMPLIRQADELRGKGRADQVLEGELRSVVGVRHVWLLLARRQWAYAASVAVWRWAPPARRLSGWARSVYLDLRRKNVARARTNGNR